MDKTIKAPQISLHIDVFKHRNLIFGSETQKAINRIFEELHKIAPCGTDDRRELWLTAPRGTIEDYGDYEELEEGGYIDSYKDFEDMWKSEFPDEINWYRLVSLEHHDFKALILGESVIYQTRYCGQEREMQYEDNALDLFLWVENSVKKCVEDIRNGLYNDNVKNNLAYRKRKGTISEKDYWKLFPERKKDYLSDISESEISLFVKNISEQIGEDPVGEYSKEMTAKQFYEYCSIGYKANDYKDLEGLSAKEQYYRHADGRDNDLNEVDENSPKAFEQWYNDRTKFGGHPWEVCRGGSFTQIDLYVMHCEKGYYLTLCGSSSIRSIETIKFYNALRREGIAIFLSDAKDIKDRLLGEGLIGILPEDEDTIMGESSFPKMHITDCINLPFEEEKAKKMIPCITWLDEVQLKLLNN